MKSLYLQSSLSASEDLALRNEVSVRNLEALVCRGGGGLADKWTILLDFSLLVIQKEE